MRRRPSRTAAGVWLLTAAVILAGSWFRLGERYELDTLDWRFRLRPPIPVSDRIALIEIDAATIDQFGRFPLDRRYHGLLIQALSRAGARAIIFDIFFSEPHPDDESLRYAIRESGRVFLPHLLALPAAPVGGLPQASGFVARTLPTFTRAARGAGHINLRPDLDGRYRRVPVAIRHGEGLVPHLAVAAGADLLNVPVSRARIRPGGEAVLGPARAIPVDESGNMMINFAGPWGKTYRHYSYTDVLRAFIAGQSGEKPVIDLTEFRGAVCLVGLTAEGTSDLRPSPFERLSPSLGIHADVLNSLLQGRFIRRAGRPFNVLVLFLLVAAAIAAILRLRPLTAAAAVGLLAAGYTTAAAALFALRGEWLDLFYPLAVSAAVFLAGILIRSVGQWKERLLVNKELSLAARVQMNFLPQIPDDIPGMEIAAGLLATAREVGGDLYDYCELPRERSAVMIGDVAGKGFPASLLMAVTVGAFRALARPDLSPGKCLSRLNERLRRDTRQRLFVTMICGVIDRRRRELDFANAGHVPLLIVTAGGERRFEDTNDGFPLGVLESSYSQRRVSLGVGDVLVFCTDGVTEARDDRERLYGRQRLADVVVAHRKQPAGAILRAVKADISRFSRTRPEDDASVMIIKFTPKEEG